MKVEKLPRKENKELSEKITRLLIAFGFGGVETRIRVNGELLDTEKKAKDGFVVQRLL